MKKQKTENEFELKNKIEFVKETYYSVELLDELVLCIKEGDDLKKNTEICKKDEKPQFDRVEIVGKSVVEVDDYVKKDDVLAVKGKLIKKKITSPHNAKVVEVSDDSIKLQIEKEPVESLGSKKIVNKISAPFDVKVVRLLDKKALLRFSSVQINLMAAKGDSATAKLEYISSQSFKNKKKLPQNLENKIIVTDYLTPDIYPIASSLGALGIITNAVDHAIYHSMIILAVPVAVISGFASEDEVKDDKKLTNYLKDKSGETVWLDTDYNRLVIPEEKQPPWLKTYSFDLNNIVVKM